MKIDITKKGKTVPLLDIKHGECFLYAGTLHLKLSVQSVHEGYTCVSLKDGKPIALWYTDRVTPFKAKIVEDK